MHQSRVKSDQQEDQQSNEKPKETWTEKECTESEDCLTNHNT